MFLFFVEDVLEADDTLLYGSMSRLYRMEFTWNWYGRGLCMGYTTTTAMFILKKIFVELLSCATAKVIIFLATTWPGCCYCCCASFAKFVYYSRLLESWAAEHHTMLFIFNALCVDSLELSRETCLLSTYLLHIYTYLLVFEWLLYFESIALDIKPTVWIQFWSYTTTSR